MGAVAQRCGPHQHIIARLCHEASVAGFGGLRKEEGAAREHR